MEGPYQLRNAALGRRERRLDGVLREWGPQRRCRALPRAHLADILHPHVDIPAG